MDAKTHLTKNSNVKRQQGFSLIELMIVVAILSILVVAALPSYQNYTVRARVTEVMAMAARDRTAVAEYFISQGAMPDTASDAGLNLDESPSEYVLTTTYRVDDDEATLVYDMSADALGATDATGEFQFTGVGSANGVLWQCDKGDFPSHFRPPQCR